jgi:hypothetical protein
MNRKNLLGVLLLISVLVVANFAGCSKAGSSMTGSGNIIDKKLTNINFTTVNIQGAFNAEIRQSDNFGVVISTDDNLVNRVLISSEGETLKFRIEAPASFFPTSLKVVITMPRIYGLYLSGGAKASLVDFISTFNFSLRVAEKSNVNGYIEAGITEFDISEGSQVSLKGVALELTLVASGGSKLDLGDFIVSRAKAKLKEGSEAIMYVNGRFDVTLNDASKIYYLGDPIITDAVISGGSIMRHK